METIVLNFPPKDTQSKENKEISNLKDLSIFIKISLPTKRINYKSNFMCVCLAENCVYIWSHVNETWGFIQSDMRF